MGHVQIDHRRVDLLVPEQCLHRVQTRPGLQQMRGEGMPQGVHRGVGHADLLARQNHQPLQRPHRHRPGAPPHPHGQLFRRARAASGAGKEQHRMAVESPVTPQVLDHLPRQRNHPVFAAFVATHHQLALIALDVMHRERKALICRPATGRQTLRAAFGSLSRRRPGGSAPRGEAPRSRSASPACGNAADGSPPTGAPPARASAPRATRRGHACAPARIPSTHRGRASRRKKGRAHAIVCRIVFGRHPLCVFTCRM